MLGGKNLTGTVVMARTRGETCQVVAPTVGAKMKARLPELQRQVTRPPEPQAPQGAGRPVQQQQWPAVGPGPAA